MQSRPCRTHPRTGPQSSTLSTPACAQAPDDASADDEAVRALLGAHFERGDAEDYVQLKDVAALLEARRVCSPRGCARVDGRATASREGGAAWTVESQQPRRKAKGGCRRAGSAVYGCEPDYP